MFLRLATYLRLALKDLRLDLRLEHGLETYSRLDLKDSRLRPTCDLRLGSPYVTHESS